MKDQNFLGDSVQTEFTYSLHVFLVALCVFFLASVNLSKFSAPVVSFVIIKSPWFPFKQTLDFPSNPGRFIKLSDSLGRNMGVHGTFEFELELIIEPAY